MKITELTVENHKRIFCRAWHFPGDLVMRNVHGSGNVTIAIFRRCADIDQRVFLICIFHHRAQSLCISNPEACSSPSE